MFDLCDRTFNVLKKQGINISRGEISVKGTKVTDAVRAPFSLSVKSSFFLAFRATLMGVAKKGVANAIL